MFYVEINTVLWLGIIAFWIITWTGNKKTVQQFNPRSRLAALIITVMIGIALYKPHGWLRTRILPDSEVVKMLGTVFCASGIAFAIWARVTLGRNWSANPTIKEGHELITRGPYHFVRHPIYTGILLGLLGSLVLEGGEVRDALMYLFIVIGLRLKSRIEEKFMLQTFPGQYPHYCRRVKAIIPFVW